MIKSLKAILTTAILLTILIFVGCDSSDSVDTADHVTITQKPLYWEIHIDYSYGDRYRIGREYGTKVLSTIPDYEVGGDAYLQASVTGIHGADSKITYEVLIERALEISKNIQDRYMDEMEGFASVLSGGLNNTLGDGKLSRNEYLMLNLIPDIFNTTACSATAVFGNRSATGQTILGRNTDWATGPPQEAQYAGINGENAGAGNINALIYLKTESKQALFFGTVGFMGTIVGINSDGVFVAGLHSQTGSPYSAEGKRAVMLDIRNALETAATVDEAGAFMGDPARLYAYHNNIFVADKNTAKVLENDYERNRALRTTDSELNPGITWGISNAVGCVNAFVLKDNFDNFTGQAWQTDRWASFKGLLVEDGDTMDIERMKTIMSYHQPGSGGMDPGDIFNAGTIQSMAYSFADNRLDLWLGTFVDDPQYVTITIPFLEDGTVATIGEAIPVAPFGAVVTEALYPTFEWTPVPNVTRYLIRLEDKYDPEVPVIEQWYTPEEGGCGDTEYTRCSITPETDLYGEYKWKVLSCNGDECGRWSRYLSFSFGLAMGPPPDRFTDNGDGTITDHHTNLMWFKNMHTNKRNEHHEVAIRFCAEAELFGYSDWRIPSYAELNSVHGEIEQDRSCYPDGPFDHRQDLQIFWSSDYVNEPKWEAWTIWFMACMWVRQDTYIGQATAWCVRDAQ